MYVSKLRFENLGFIGKSMAFFNNRFYLKRMERLYGDILDSVNGYKLDRVQREIVLSEEDSTLVIAGAGSGKSLTILGRILYLVNRGVSPDDILCISFTNMASDNLRKSLLRNGVSLNVYTFHKLGMEILRNNGFNINIADENVLSFIVEKVLKKYDLTDVLPDCGFVDVGDGDFNELHRLLLMETSDYFNLKCLFKTFINLFKVNNYDVFEFDNFLRVNSANADRFKRFRNEKLLMIAKDIYEAYSYELERNRLIDFNDMINDAILAVNNFGIRKYKYIIVDEYQDTSISKCELLRVIKDYTGAKIMVVGDDFQSIYQFAGSNLDVFFNFSSFFSGTRIFKLEKTYRNSQELLDIMGKFILKNKNQLYKRLVSDKSVSSPILVYYYDDNFDEVMKEVLSFTGRDVLILGRSNKDIYGIDGWCMTVHKSKGLEASNVIIVNLEDGINGFPNRICDDDLLKFVKSSCDDFLYAEERRLFYVAMTRTRNCNYLLVNRKRPSRFVLELLLENKNVCVVNGNMFCPRCGSRLIKRNGRYGKFFGCKNYPKCRYTRK